MITLIKIKNPFDVRQREIIELPYIGDKAKCYFSEEGNWTYIINNNVGTADSHVADGDFITITPYVGKKALSLVLSIGLAYFTGGLAAGTILGGLSTGLRLGIALAASMIGGSIITKLTAPPKVDSSNEQSVTYGWGGARTVTGQGTPLAVTYGRMKTGGVLLSRHVSSDGEKQYLNMLLSAGEGELSSIEDIRINGNPIDNYKDVAVDIRLGTNNQDIIPSFGDSYSDQPLQYELTSGWSTHRVQGNTADAIEITVSFPQGLYYANDKGGTSETWVDIYGEIREVGGSWTPLPLALEHSVDRAVGVEKRNLLWFSRRNNESISATGAVRIKNSSSKGLNYSFRFDNLEKKEYELRLRAEKEGTTVRYSNKVYWGQITQILYDDFIHPCKALLGIRALATEQLSGNDPNVTWVQTREHVQVWNPYQKTYQGKPADNPAWACYDILHQCRKIDGQYITNGCPAKRMDYDAFNAWAGECESAGFTFNYIYDGAVQLWDALQLPENIGRGKVIMKGTRFSCVYDYASDPVQLFTVANILKDSLHVDYLALTGRANAVEISFMNKLKEYERDVLPVYSPDYDNDQSLSTPTQIELMGCTDSEQAYQHGRWYLRNNRYEIRTITFDASIDAIASTIGDVVLVQHDVPEWGYGGRVVAVDGEQITLDTTVSMNKRKKYQLLVRSSQTDEIQTLDVVNTNTDTNTITVKGGNISVDDVFAFGAVGQSAKPYRITGIKRNSNDLTRTIIAVEYHKELYTTDKNIPIVDINRKEYGLHVSRLLLTKTENVNKDGSIVCDINVAWVMPRGKTAKEIRVYYKRFDETNYTPFGTFHGGDTSCTISSVLTDTNYVVKVVCVDDFGIVGSEVEETINVTGKTALPAFPSDFRVEQNANNPIILHMTWTPLAIPDIKGYRLYDGLGNELVNIIYGNTFNYFIPQTGTYEFELKAVDTSGNESETGAKAKIKAVVDANKIEVPNAPADGTVEMTKEIVVTWSPVVNTYVDFYEVRTDTNTGRKTGLLAKTADFSAVIDLSSRTGAVLVYAHSPIKGYGEPLTISYAFEKPPIPEVEMTKETADGFAVKVNGIPRNCLGVKIWIENDEQEIFTSQSSYFVYKAVKGGIYRVFVAYYDCIGEGDKTGEILATVPVTIPKELIDAEALGLQAMQDAVNDIDRRIQEGLENIDLTEIKDEVKGVSTRVAQLSNAIDSKVSSEEMETRITQTESGIQLKVSEKLKNLNEEEKKSLRDDVVSALTIGDKSITLDSPYIHIGGHTKIDGNLITDNIQSNSIGADKLKVTSLSSITATIGTLRTRTSGARLEIKDDVIKVYDNRRLRVQLGDLSK